MQFSVIIPVYNVEKYLSKCIDSILSQKYNDYEIILVDDGSPDLSPKICDEYAVRYCNVRVIHKTNGGLSDARNVGLRYAKGKYVTFVDSDDFWIGDDVFENVLGIILKFDPDIVLCDCIKYYSDNRLVYPKIKCSSDYNGCERIEIIKYLYYTHADLKIAAWQKFVRTSLLKNLDFTVGLLSEDIDWSLALYPKAKSICLLDKPYYCYRQNRKGSITSTSSQKSFDSLLYIINKWKVLIPKMGLGCDETRIYLGYLAFQLSVAMTNFLSISPNNRHRAITLMTENLHLFSYELNFKSMKVKKFIDVLGLRCTCRILSIYRRLKS